ncbi:hypothetical protein FGO68_gene2096 [Halteria grandinella]|uniref:TRP C-terminal domain-containing protein n=1 Tax=Halteria grandinella TaxID=5974 RepID=A0A8J8P5M9_HALGN|nr:hypothetical protein FGO68_gene2096 [Halteria grandinella]
MNHNRILLAICIITAASHALKASGFSCTQTKTPIMAGGSNGNMEYTAMDLDNDLNIVAGGACRDSGACSPASSGSPLPFIDYIEAPADYKWHKYFKNMWGLNQQQVGQIAFFGSTTIMAVLQKLNSNSFIILELNRADGSIKSAYKEDSPVSSGYFSPRGLFADTTTNLITFVGKLGGTFSFMQLDYSTSGASTKTLALKWYSSDNTDPQCSAGFSLTQWSGKGFYIGGRTKSGTDCHGALLARIGSDGLMKWAQFSTHTDKPRLTSLDIMEYPSTDAYLWICGTSKYTSTQQRMYIQRTKLATADPYQPMDNKVLIQTSLSTSSEIVQCHYARGISTDVSKGYAIGFSDGGTVGYSELYVMQVDMTANTIKYYSDALNNFWSTENYHYDAIIPKSLDYAFFVGGISQYDSTATLYLQGTIVKVPLTPSSTADTSQGLSYIVNYNQPIPTAEQTNLGFQFQSSYTSLILETGAVTFSLIPTSGYAGATLSTSIYKTLVSQTQSLTIIAPTVTNQIFDKGTQTSGSYQVGAFTFQGGCTEAVTYTAQKTSNPVVADMSGITFDTATRTFAWTNVVPYSVYTLKVIVTVTATGQQQAVQFTLTVTSSTDCSQSVITSSQSTYTLETYTISNAQIFKMFNPMTSSMPSCSINYALYDDSTGIAAPSIYSIDSTTFRVYIGQSFDNSLVTTLFTLRVTGFISGYPLVSQSFTIPVKVLSSCTIQSVILNSGNPLLPPMSFDINDATTTATQTFSTVVTIQQPALTFSVTDGAGNAMDSSVYSVTRINGQLYATFTVSTSSSAFAGPSKQVYIKPVFSDCNLLQTLQVTVTINNRCSTAFTIAPILLPQTYTLGEPIKYYQLPAFTKSDPTCAYSYGATKFRNTDVIESPFFGSVFTFDPVNLRVSMVTSDSAYLTTYSPVSILVKSSPVSNPAAQSILTFQIFVHSPCEYATISMIAPTQPVLVDGTTPVSVTLTFQSSVASSFNCGAWQHAVISVVDSSNIPSPSMLASLSLVSNVLTIAVTDETLSELSPFTATIIASQNGFLGVTGNGVVSIIMGCRIKSIAPDARDVEDEDGVIAEKMGYLIGSGERKFGFREFVIMPERCREEIGYQATTIGGSALPGYISYKERNIKVKSINRNLAGQQLLINITPVLSPTSTSNPSSISSLIIPIQFSYPNTGPPSFTQQLQKLTLYINDTQTYYLPPYSDPDSLDSIRLSHSQLPPFVTLQYPILTIAPTEKSTHVGTFPISIILTDDNPNPLSNTYEIQITVKYEAKAYSESGEEDNDQVELKEQSVDRQASIKSISSNGEVVIGFNFPLVIPEDISQIDMNSLLCILIPGDSIDGGSNTILQWNMINFQERSITIKLNFTNPIGVSNSYERDKLEIKFNANSNILKEATTQKQVRITNRLVKDIPRQLDDEDIATLLLQRQSQSIKAGATAFVMSNMVLNVVLASSLQYLWGMINVMQLIVHMPLMNLVFPANAVLFYNFIIDISNFDILPVDSMENKLFKFTDSPSQPWFEQLGYNQNPFLQNMGSMMIYVCVYLGLSLSVPFIGYIKGRNSILAKLYTYLRENFFFNSFLRLFLEGYMQFSICSLISTSNALWDSSSDRLSTVLGLIFTTCITLFPFLVWILLWRQLPNLKYKHSEQTYGSLYNEIRSDNRGAVVYSVVYMIRRLVFVIIALTLHKYPYAQAQLVIFCSIIVIIYNILVKPFSIPRLNELEVFNEICILIAAYHLVMFTDFDLSDPKASIDLHLQIQYKCGWSMIAITTLNILVNMLVMLVESFYNLKLGFKKASYYLRRQLSNWAKARKYQAKDTFNDTHTPLQLLKRDRLTSLPTSHEPFSDFFQIQHPPSPALVHHDTQQTEDRQSPSNSASNTHTKQSVWKPQVNMVQSKGTMKERKGSVEEESEVLRMRRRWKEQVVKGDRVKEEMEEGI